ncbi:uncharacterized protein (TIGR01619 family) [Pontibacter aydingkolensis]|uniref:DUF695 domain-containing protein n=1 Tax=Pontibacter aydingkolensis TaxID=1911536 RepID=A0ABS7CZ03_9BACT|nr:DUF695 domain-containing protein [Pontibacter aydingkolensis]MBW7469061.1 DUF695 domain-containing protein [Pontibacter aydingkolensis]
MSNAHQADWDVYFCYLEDTPAFITVDLGLYNLAPLPGKPNLIEVVARLQTTNEDGFPDNEEWTKLEEIEDMLVNSFEEKLEAVFVGKTLNSGRRGLYFYSGDTLLVEQMVDELRSHFPEYTFEHQLTEDPNWEVYFEYLFPDEESLLRIQNNKILQLLEEQGDQAYIPRKITYTLYFRTSKDRAEALQEIKGAGFEVEDESDQEKEELPHRLILSNQSKANEETIYLTTEMLMQLAIKYDGEYDGWETQIVQEND